MLSSHGRIKLFLLDEKRAERSLLSHLEEISEDDITPLLDATFSLAEWRQVSYTTLFSLATSCLARYSLSSSVSNLIVMQDLLW